MKNISFLSLLTLISLSLNSCDSAGTLSSAEEAPFTWSNANIYFLLTDRFQNGDPGNDLNFDRREETAVLRGFEGGDIMGVIQKIEEGYFDRLGITALWVTPWFAQIQGCTNEGTGNTYAFHGYWPSDWTAMDPNFGKEEDLVKLVETAHAHGIRIVMDVIINHTGPVTPDDPVWPDEWVRTEPACTYADYKSTIECTLVKNLPDIRTESNEDVDLPPMLLKKWKEEGRLEKEMAELDAFFERTAYPRAPKYYIIKWLTDYIRKYGIDAYRLDTTRHIEEGVWSELWKEAELAFEEWKNTHPEAVLDENPFFMFGEVYGYSIMDGRYFHFSDTSIDYFNYGMESMINFHFKEGAKLPYEQLFSTYSRILREELDGKSVINYISSHDDAWPYDVNREHSIEGGTKLLLAPGASQVYYGDESLRVLKVEGADGDANLRSLMNWDEIENNIARNGVHVAELMKHYQKLGMFRKKHPAIGAGLHQMLSAEPYLFTRTYKQDGYQDLVLVGLDLESGLKVLEVGDVFSDGTKLKDAYSGKECMVKDGRVDIESEFSLVLLETI